MGPLFARVTERIRGSVPTEGELDDLAMEFVRLLRASGSAPRGPALGQGLAPVTEAFFQRKMAGLRAWLGASAAGRPAADSAEWALRVALATTALPPESMRGPEAGPAASPGVGLALLRAQLLVFALFDAAEDHAEVPHREELAHRACLDAAAFLAMLRQVGVRLDPYASETAAARRERAVHTLEQLGEDLTPGEHASLFAGVRRSDAVRR